MSTPTIGEVLTLDIGPVGAGGVCVSRHDGHVVFVRHTLPGERVRARVTGVGGGGKFLRADAVEIEQASPDRVQPPCPVAGPGGCGGCDWQHATLGAQRQAKARVVIEQFRRIAHLDVTELMAIAAQENEVTVRAVPDLRGEAGGLGWRTRVRFSANPAGELGFHRWHQEAVVPVEECPLAHREIRALGLPRFRWPSGVDVEAAVGGFPDDAALVIVSPPGPARQRRRRPTPRRSGPVAAAVPLPDLKELPSVEASLAVRSEAGAKPTRVHGRSWIRHRVVLPEGEREFRVSGGGFWQGHPAAAQTLVEAVLRLGAPQPGEQVLDLFSGVGLFAAALGEAVGESGDVIAVEGEDRAVADARRNMHGLPQVRLVHSDVADWLHAGGPDGVVRADLVVLDPPRSGAGIRAMTALAVTGARLVYVACDPAALARDVAVAVQAGYRLVALEAFDLFPMTHHVECVALLEPSSD